MKSEIAEIINQINRGKIPVGYKRTTEGVIPHDWKVRKLADVARYKNGTAHERHVDDNGEFIIVNSKFIATEGREFKRTHHNLSPLQQGDIAMVLSDVPNGKALAKCFLVDAGNRYTLNQRICSIEAVDVDYKYLYYFLDRNKYFLQFDSGVGQTNLRKDEVLDCPLVLPAVVEQQRIAEVLSLWDRAIVLKEKLIHQMTEQNNWLMQSLLSGRVRLPGFTKKWTEVTLGQIGSTYSGLAGKSKKDFGRGKPYVPYKNVFDGKRIDMAALEYVDIADGEKQNQVKYGDIIFTTSSETPEEAGMSSVLLDHCDELYLNSFCFGVRLNDFSVLTPEFSQHFFRGDVFRRQLLRLAQGSTRFNLSKNEVQKIRLKVPEVTEQQEIALLLTTADREVELLQKELEGLQQQRKGLMQLLLAGIIRVTT